MLLTASMQIQARDLEKIQKDFLKLKFGMFMHFNMSTFVPGGWSTGKEDPLKFNLDDLDIGQWADAAKAAKMNYGILTVKHTGGWCLWPTKTTDHNVSLFKNYKNGKADIVQEFVDAFRSRGLKVGFYYCFPLWGKVWPNYMTLPNENYATGNFDAAGLIKAQFTELLTNYGDISVIWVDQSGSTNGGLKPGDWQEIKQLVHKLQPNCVVLANNAVDFNHSDILGFEYPYSLELPAPGNTKPTEVCDKLNGGWFANPAGEAVPVHSAKYIVNKMLLPALNSNCNYLLNCSPEHTGKLHPKTVAVLEDIGTMWDPDNIQKYDKNIYGIITNAVESIITEQPLCYICFDSKLDQATRAKAAAILKAHHARATFFVSRNSVEKEKASLRALVKAGHALGNPTTATEPLNDKSGLKIGSHIYPIQKHITQLDKPVVTIIPENRYSWNIWTALNYFSLAAIKPGYTVSDTATAYTAAEKIHAGEIIVIKSTAQAINSLENMLETLTARGLKCENIRNGMLHSTDPRLQLLAKEAGAKVETGRE